MRCRGPLVLIALGLVFAGFDARPAPSAGPAELDGAGWLPLRLIQLPLVDLALLEGAPFAQPGGGADGVGQLRQLARRRVELERTIRGLAVSLDLVEPLGEEQLRAAVAATPSLAGQAMVADERLALGRERWLGLEPSEALAQFDVADRLMRAAFVDVLASDRFAELALWRGLALAELGREPEAQGAFQIMFLHDPARRFTKGWYGGRVERLLDAAAVEARASADPLALRYPPARLAELGALIVDTPTSGGAKRSGVSGGDEGPTAVLGERATHWLVGTLRPRLEEASSASSLELQLRTLRGRGADLESATARLTIEAPAFTEASLLRNEPGENLSRWLSAWHVCALEASSANPLEWTRRSRRVWHLELAYRHDLWLHHRQTRLALHGPGVGLAAAWEPQPWLQLWGRFAQVTTLADARGDLLAQFGSTHLGLGAGLRLGGETLSLSLRLGVATAFTLNDFEATTDIDCKFFGPDNPRCGAIFVARAPLWWLGVESGIGLRWNLAPGWHLGALVSVDAFLASSEAVRELNYPLAFTLGFGASL